MCLIVTRLLLAMVAQMEIASPGTYPPRSKRTLQVTAPLVMQVNPILCSISQWNGCCKKCLLRYRKNKNHTLEMAFFAELLARLLFFLITSRKWISSLRVPLLTWICMAPPYKLRLHDAIFYRRQIPPKKKFQGSFCKQNHTLEASRVSQSLHHFKKWKSPRGKIRD